MIIKPIYGCSSPDTAYVVDDYPYGLRVRTRIQYWIEDGGKKGYRSVYQTQNPNTGRWNAPKKSTYSLVAMAMYLDEKGHVTHAALNEYSEASDVLSFCKTFPGVDRSMMTSIAGWCAQKSAFKKSLLDRKVHFTIGGVARPESDADMARHAEELEVWLEALACAKSHLKPAEPRLSGAARAAELGKAGTYAEARQMIATLLEQGHIDLAGHIEAALEDEFGK